MRLPVRTSIVALALAVAGVLLLPAGGGAAPQRGCASFSSQSDAQAHFFRQGGRPGKGPRRLDRDRDGVACEQLPGPHAGFAAIGYHKRKRFFYGYAWMPEDPSGEGYTCLHGNRRFPDGARTLNVYRVVRGKARPLRPRRVGIPAQADPATGTLVWKLKARKPRGRFFAAFEARIPLAPYGRNQCPGFRSYTIQMPKPQR